MIESLGKKHSLWNTIARNVSMFGLLNRVCKNFLWTLFFMTRKKGWR